MALGPGKYDAEVTELRERLKADGIVLIVVGGERGQGFCAQLKPLDALRLPRFLRIIADQIEERGPGVE